MYEFDYDIRGNVSMVKNAIIQINFEYDHLESGDLYADVGTQGGPCVVYREVIAIKLVLNAIQFAEEILKNGLELIDKLKKKKDPVEQKGGSNQMSSCGGVAT